MITLKQWMELVNYKITEGGEFGWRCYGPFAYALSSWNGVHGNGGWSFSIVFDTKTQTVYEVDACDYTNNRAYRLINPLFKSSLDAEVKSRIDSGMGYIDEAWEGVSYIDLELDEDFMKKSEGIIKGIEYDTRVSISIELEEHEMLTMFNMAHERDITLNQLVEEILKEYINKNNGQ